MKPKKLGEVMPGASEEAIDLLSKMLVFNPKHRIDIQGVVNHPYLNNTTLEKPKEDLSYLEALKNIDCVEKLIKEKN